MGLSISEQVEQIKAERRKARATLLSELEAELEPFIREVVATELKKYIKPKKGE